MLASVLAYLHMQPGLGLVALLRYSQTSLRTVTLITLKKDSETLCLPLLSLPAAVGLAL